MGGGSQHVPTFERFPGRALPHPKKHKMRRTGEGSGERGMDGAGGRYRWARGDHTRGVLCMKVGERGALTCPSFVGSKSTVWVDRKSCTHTHTVAGRQVRRLCVCVSCTRVRRAELASRVPWRRVVSNRTSPASFLSDHTDSLGTCRALPSGKIVSPSWCTHGGRVRGGG